MISLINSAIVLISIHFLIFINYKNEAKLSQSAYNILGISQKASQKEIKNAYRQLAKDYHPDNSDLTREKFIEISNAYELLKTPESRQNYDRFGEDGPPKMQHPNMYRRYNSHVTFTFSNGKFYQHHHKPVEDLFLNSEIEFIKAENFDNLISNRKWAVLLYMYSNTTINQNFQRFFIKFHKDINPIVPFYLLNCSNDKQLCMKFNSISLPSFFLFEFPIKDRIYIYSNREFSYNIIVNWIESIISFQGQILTEKNFDDFFKNNNEKLKLIYFSHKDPSLKFNSALNKYKNKIDIGLIGSNSISLLSKFSSKNIKFPSLLQVNNILTLQGNWLPTEFDSYKSMIDLFEKIQFQEIEENNSLKNDKDNYKEISQKHLLKGRCFESPSIACIIFLNDNSNNEIGQNILINSISEKYLLEAIEIFSVNIKQQPNFVDSFDFSNLINPRLIILNEDKYKVFKYEDTLNITQILEDYLNGILILNLKLIKPLKKIANFISDEL